VNPPPLPTPGATQPSPPGAVDGFDVLTGLTVGLLCVAPDWRIVYANERWSETVGIPLADAIGHDVWELVPSSLGSAREALVRATMADGVPRSYDSPPPKWRGGGVLHVDLRRTPSGMLVFTVRDASTAPPHGAADATALREAAAEQERLRALTRALAAQEDAAALIDTVCAAAVELCDARGGTVAQIEGEMGTFICIVGHPEELRDRRFRVAGTLTDRALREYRHTRRLTSARADVGEADDSAFYPYLADGRVVGPLLLAPLGAHGELLGVLAVSRALGEPPFSDRDEQRLRVIADHASLALWKARLIDEARAANATKSNFLAMVSHELRTPLTALTGYGELLADEIVGPLTVPQHEIVERVRNVTHQLTAMIEEILTYSSLDAGRELVRPRPVDVSDVLGGVASVIQPLATQKGLAFSLRIDPAVPRFVTDPDKARQILVNLAGNAVKFTEEGAVDVAVEACASGEIRFTVADSGVGIDAADLPRLFQPFTQLDTGLTRRYGGTGLGLYISRRMAELLGGYSEVESHVGRGSRFSLLLPPVTPERPDRTAESAAD
jgi:signal transduction histidine kinase